MSYEWQLHTHTSRCKHAAGDAMDYAAVAAAGGCRVLGMADHCPWPDGRWADVRMAAGELDDYVAAVQAADAAHPELQVLLGLEVEYVPELRHWIEDEFLGRIGCRYLIGAGHYVLLDGEWQGAFAGLEDPQRLAAYTRQMVSLIASGLFAFIAHPDMVGCSYAGRPFDIHAAVHARALCEAARDCGVPLELNGYGLRKPWIADGDAETGGGERPRYPWQPFWEIAADVGCSVVCSSDAHRPEDTLANGDALRAMADHLGLRLASLDEVLGPSTEAA